uniref:Acyl-coenzyme A thioesterase 13 n=2 Tax=Ascaris TaxID=6251 RepID=A0A0M3ISX3_ASCLU
MASKYLAAIKQIYKSYETAKGFCKFASGCRVLSVSEGHVKVEMDVTEELLNPPGTLHGGCTATLVDIVTTTALMATERAHPGVSVDLIVSYLAAAHPGETIVIDASVLRAGRTLAYTRADVFRKKDNLLIATAQHTKAFPASKQK